MAGRRGLLAEVGYQWRSASYNLKFESFRPTYKIHQGLYHREFLCHFDQDIGMTNQWTDWLRSSARDLNVSLNEEKIRLLDEFIRELSSANQTVNLTGITSPLEIAESLILDSIFPGQYLRDKTQVLDLGTGAGFPGIPLKIVYPDFLMTLIDAKRKKINFLKYMIRQLGLEGISARQIRAEELAGQGGRFDVVITRAVSSLDALIQMGLPLLKKDGVFVAMKGSNYQAEIDGLKQMTFINVSGEKCFINQLTIDIETYRLPVSGILRALIFVRA